jgi:PadR family transcriptional regulator PadR
MDGKKSIEHTTLLVLSLLSGQDMYGYEMITELERRSEKAFHMQEGTLYPVLKKLENCGAVKSYTAEFSGRTRKYYHITDSGLKTLKSEQEDWLSYSQGINAVLSCSPLTV